MKVENGAIISFSTKKFSKTHFIKKAFHYLIEWFTQSEVHHQAIYCKGLYEAMANTGVRKITLDQKRKEISKHVEMIIENPKTRLTDEEVNRMQADLNNQLGKKYSYIEAFLSILTAILIFDKKEIRTKKMFCSKLVIYAVKNIRPAEFYDKIPRHFNPDEALKKLKKIEYI